MSARWATLIDIWQPFAELEQGLDSLREDLVPLGTPSLPALRAEKGQGDPAYFGYKPGEDSHAAVCIPSG